MRSWRMDLRGTITLARLDQRTFVRGFLTRDKNKGQVLRESVTSTRGTEPAHHVAHRKTTRYTRRGCGLHRPCLALLTRNHRYLTDSRTVGLEEGKGQIG
jgi:hypothetical protein